MKIFHISDLHIGKKFKEFSMLDDQEYILSEIIKTVDIEIPDCVVIAGDIYDKTIPPTDAVILFDKFLYDLSKRKIPTLIISGNHDSPERVSFGGRLMEAEGIYISPVFNGEIKPVVLQDEIGDVNFYLFPFVKPVQVRKYFPDKKIESYQDAVKTVIDSLELKSDSRNVLVAHQFVTGSTLGNSEEFMIGGAENVDAELFMDFDYTALGHIHHPQNVGSEKIRYCGSPLKYHFDEHDKERSFTIAELGKKGELSVREILIKPKREMRYYKGSYDRLTSKNFYENVSRDDYVFITLTDEEDIPDASLKLKKIYPNLLQLFYDNSRTQSPSVIRSEIRNEKLPPIQIFTEFYKNQCNHDMTAAQKEIMEKLINKIWESEIL